MRSKTRALIEAVRLLTTLATTAVGFRVGRNWHSWFSESTLDADVAIVSGAVLGAGVGYVFGGAVGRIVRQTMDGAPGFFARLGTPQLFAGAFGVLVALVASAFVGAPLVMLLPGPIGWPVAGLLALVVTTMAARIFSGRGGELFGAVAAAKPVAWDRVGAVDATGYLLDTSAAIDGRVLELVRSGLLPDPIFVPAFVIDELQAIADSGDRSRRRRGRRGLDVLDAIRDVAPFTVVEETVPEATEVDAKLLALAARRDVALITTDHNLARAAGLRGIAVLNPHSLGEALRGDIATGDTITVSIEKEGSEPGQGVGFLDDGTMVVVADAAEFAGTEIDAEIVNMLRTSVGRMIFARVVE